MLKYRNINVKSNVIRKELLTNNANVSKRGIADPLYQELVASKRELLGPEYINPKFSKNINTPNVKLNSHSSRVFHGINVSNFEAGSRLHCEQEETLNSILNADPGDYEIVLFGDSEYKDVIPSEFHFKLLNRTACTAIEGASKNLPFIHDIMNGLSAMADDHDWLLMTNVDCSVIPSIYNELNYMACNVVEYKRQDLLSDGSTFVVDWGIDGIAVRKHIWEDIKKTFPDFILGACHWDQGVYSFNKQTEQYTSLDVESLIHKEHEPQWDYFNPDIYDQYNIKLLDEMYEKLEIPMGYRPEFVQGPLNQPSCYSVRKPVYNDTHIVYAIWGKDEHISSNIQNVLTQIQKQTMQVNVILVELLFPNEDTAFPDGIDGTHIIINGDDENRSIFQKEALWNIGSQEIPDDHYCIFSDSDVWSDDKDWLYKIRVRLDRHDNSVVQGFAYTNDTQDGSMNLSSYMRKHSVGVGSDGVGTGVVHGMSKSYYDMIGGFNPFAIVSNGDTLFTYEVIDGVKSTCIDRFYSRREFVHWDKMVRDVPKCHPDSVYVTLNHEYHGSFNSRKYILRALTVQSFKNEPESYIEMHDGLVRWKDSTCPERFLIDNINRYDNLDELLNGSKYEI